MSKKLVVGVIFGGQSGEHEVSLCHLIMLLKQWIKKDMMWSQLELQKKEMDDL